MLRQIKCPHSRGNCYADGKDVRQPTSPQSLMAESQGFEPWTPYGALVFETSSLILSDNSPRINIKNINH